MHPRLAQGDRAPNNFQPEGLVYEEVYETMLNLFRVSYMKSRGLDYDGVPDLALD